MDAVEWFVACGAATIFMLIGISMDSHFTLQDCATKGISKMVNGASIKCEVVREKANNG